MIESWAEKYRPKKIEDVVGNFTAIRSIKKWATDWENDSPSRKGIVLSGPAGSGKTSTALAIANTMGWEVIELNASDARSAGAIEGVALRGSLFQSFSNDGEFNRRKLILIDEADHLYERGHQSKNREKDYGDRGGKRAIIKTLEETKQPVVLTVNDLYGLTKGAGAKIKRMITNVKFYPLDTEMVFKSLKRIADNEKIKVENNVLDELAKRAKGDLRAAINDFQSIGQGRNELRLEDIEEIGNRDNEYEMFETLKIIFEKMEFDEPRRAAFELDGTPNELSTWVVDNLPYVYRDSYDRERAYRRLAQADLLLSRAVVKQRYDLWGYATELISSGVSLSKKNPIARSDPRFPAWLRKMASSRIGRINRDKLAAKLGRILHVSKREILSNQIHVLRKICLNDHDKASRIAGKANLTKEELAFLLDCKGSDGIVKGIMDESEKYREGKEIIKLKNIPINKVEEVEEKIQPKVDPKQKNIFEF